MLDATQLMGWVGGSHFLLLVITQSFGQWRSKIRIRNCFLWCLQFGQCYPNPYKEETGIFVLERFTEFSILPTFQSYICHGLGVRQERQKPLVGHRPWERCAANTSENTTEHEPQQKKQLKTKDWCCGNITKLKLV